MFFKSTQNKKQSDYVLRRPRYSGDPSPKFCRLDSGLRRNDKNKAFSLVELMVVIGIFAIISGVVIFDYGRFSSNLIVTNLAYESALAVRQAQVYGISVKQTKAAQNTSGVDENASYGVWFSAGDMQNFYLFADNPLIPGNANKFDIDNNEEEELFSMNGSNVISRFCVTPSGGGTAICNSSDSSDALSIIFKRPDPNAKIYGYFSSGNISEGSKAEIMFTSGRGDKEARMTVTSTGQISVDSCNAPGKECPK
jgi:prepilin-type N-terminal cleavage/methylation domain-containing protein